MEERPVFISSTIHNRGRGGLRRFLHTSSHMHGRVPWRGRDSINATVNKSEVMNNISASAAERDPTENWKTDDWPYTGILSGGH